MTGFREEMAVRRSKSLCRALTDLANAARHDDDAFAVRITLSTADGSRSYGTWPLKLLPLTELVDVIQARATSLERSADAVRRQLSPDPTPGGLLLVKNATK